MKQCCECNEIKTFEDFHTRTDSGYKRPQCKVCYNLATTKNGIKRRYGIEHEMYLELMATSDCCEICNSKNRLVYDHAHDTMEFRGVLCSKCNRGLGFLGDNLKMLERAIKYLKGE